MSGSDLQRVASQCVGWEAAAPWKALTCRGATPGPGDSIAYLLHVCTSVIPAAASGGAQRLPELLQEAQQVAGAAASAFANLAASSAAERQDATDAAQDIGDTFVHLQSCLARVRRQLRVEGSAPAESLAALHEAAEQAGEACHPTTGPLRAARLAPLLAVCIHHAAQGDLPAVQAEQTWAAPAGVVDQVPHSLSLPALTQVLASTQEDESKAADAEVDWAAATGAVVALIAMTCEAPWPAAADALRRGALEVAEAVTDVGAALRTALAVPHMSQGGKPCSSTARDALQAASAAPLVRLLNVAHSVCTAHAEAINSAVGGGVDDITGRALSGLVHVITTAITLVQSAAQALPALVGAPTASRAPVTWPALQAAAAALPMLQQVHDASDVAPRVALQLPSKFSADSGQLCADDDFRASVLTPVRSRLAAAPLAGSLGAVDVEALLNTFADGGALLALQLSGDSSRFESHSILQDLDSGLPPSALVEPLRALLSPDLAYLDTSTALPERGAFLQSAGAFLAAAVAHLAAAGRDANTAAVREGAGRLLAAGQALQAFARALRSDTAWARTLLAPHLPADSQGTASPHGFTPTPGMPLPSAPPAVGAPAPAYAGAGAAPIMSAYGDMPMYPGVSQTGSTTDGGAEGGGMADALKHLSSMPTPTAAVVLFTGQVMTGHADGSLFIWDVTSGSVVQELPKQQGPITALAPTAGEACAMSASGSTLCLWHIGSATPCATIFNHGLGPVHSLVPLAGGAKVAVAGTLSAAVLDVEDVQREATLVSPVLDSPGVASSPRPKSKLGKLGKLREVDDEPASAGAPTMPPPPVAAADVADASAVQTPEQISAQVAAMAEERLQSGILGKGSLVRVDPSLTSVTHGWGSVRAGDLGIVVEAPPSGAWRVCFSDIQSSWSADMNQLVAVRPGVFLVGDLVRLKEGVAVPKLGMGSHRWRDTGKVKAVTGSSVTVDFPHQSSWRCSNLELELVGSHGFRVGDLVTVREDVAEPKYKWGSVSKGDVGVVVKLCSREKLYVDFPQRSGWAAHAPEMRRVGMADPHPGLRVRVRSGLASVQFGWGSVRHGHVGTLVGPTGPALKWKADFPAQSGWVALAPELEPACAAFALGDLVRVCSHIEEPKYKWGSLSRDKTAVGRIVADLGKVDSDDHSYRVAFHCNPSWKALASELERLVPGVYAKGDRVRVVADVDSPRFGSALPSPEQVGVVESMDVSDGSVMVNWTGTSIKVWNVELQHAEACIEGGRGLVDPGCTAAGAVLQPAMPTSSEPYCGLKVGDQVQVRPTVAAPKYGWGSVKHGHVGTVVKLESGDQKIRVDFPSQKNWAAHAPEMMRASGGGGDSGPFRVGDLVQVRPTVTSPKFGWGSVKHGHVGTVVKVESDQKIRVDFPSQKNWAAHAPEMMRASGGGGDSGSLKVGDYVIVRPDVTSPQYGWGSVEAGHVGYLASMDGTKAKVHFIVQQNWTAAVSELQLAPAVGPTDLPRFRVGDEVRIKSSVTSPKFGWGSLRSGTRELGVVKGITHPDCIEVDWPESGYKGWKAGASDLEPARVPAPTPSAPASVATGDASGTAETVLGIVGLPVSAVKLSYPTRAPGAVQATVTQTGQLVLGHAGRGSLGIWDTMTGKREKLVGQAVGEGVSCLLGLDTGHVIAGFADGSARMLDVQSGDTVHSLHRAGNTSPLVAFLQLPWGDLAGVSSDGRLSMWSGSSGQLVGVSTLPGSPVALLALQQEQTLLVTTQGLHIVPELVDVHCRHLAAEGAASSPPTAVAAGEGLCAALLGVDRVHVWSVELGAVIATVTGLGAIRGVAMLPGPMLAVATTSALHFLNPLEEDSLPGRGGMPVSTGGSSISCLAAGWRPGSLIVGLDDGRALLVEGGGQSPGSVLQSHPATTTSAVSVITSGQGGCILVHADGSVAQWVDGAGSGGCAWPASLLRGSGPVAGAVPTQHGVVVAQRDGTLSLLGGSTPCCLESVETEQQCAATVWLGGDSLCTLHPAAGDMRVWRVGRQKLDLTAVLPCPTAQCVAVLELATGTLCAGLGDGSVAVLSTALTRAPPPKWSGGLPADFVAVCGAGDDSCLLAVTASASGDGVGVDPVRGQCALRVPELTSSKGCSMGRLPDGRCVLGTPNGLSLLTADLSLDLQIAMPAAPSTLAVLNGHLIATAHDCTVTVWDIQRGTGQELCTTTCPGRVAALAPIRGGLAVAIAGTVDGKGFLKVLAAAGTSQGIATDAGGGRPLFTSPITAMAAVGSISDVAVATADGRLAVWDLDAAVPLRRAPGSWGFATCLVALRDGTVIGAGASGTVCAWDTLGHTSLLAAGGCDVVSLGTTVSGGVVAGTGDGSLLWWTAADVARTGPLPPTGVAAAGSSNDSLPKLPAVGASSFVGGAGRGDGSAVEVEAQGEGEVGLSQEAQKAGALVRAAVSVGWPTLGLWLPELGDGSTHASLRRMAKVIAGGMVSVPADPELDNTCAELQRIVQAVSDAM